MFFSSVQDAVNSLTLFKYLCLIMHCYIKTSIDGSIFYLYYLYCLSIFQRTCRFRFKSGCKGKRFIFNCQTFSEVFSFFLFTHFSGSLCERERMYKRKETKDAFFTNRTAKIRTLFHIFQNFFEVFLFLCWRPRRAFSLSQSYKAFFSWKAGAKVGPFHIYSKYIRIFFRSFFEGFC